MQSRTILGDQLEVAAREVGTDADRNEVLSFDLPLSRAGNAAATSRRDQPR